MNSMKRILACLLVLVTLVGLSSCGMPETPEEAIVSLAEAGCDAREYESSYLLSTVGIARADVLSMVLGDDGNDHGCIVFFCETDAAAERVEVAIKAALTDATTVSIVELALGFEGMLTYEIERSGSVVAFGHERLVSAL